MNIGYYCHQEYCIENPAILLLIIPIIIGIIFIVNKDFIKFKTPEEKKKFKKRKRKYRVLIVLSRVLILTMILVAAALPYTVEEIESFGDPKIKLLYDDSKSMEVFENTLTEVKKTIESQYQLDLSQISTGVHSEIGEGILKQIEGNDNLLIISDGNNNFGKELVDVGIYSRLSNSRLFAFDLENSKNDAYVKITGPSETISSTPTRFHVKVEHIGAQPSFTLQVYVDDNLEFSGQNIFEKDILKTFGEGYHKITAKIIIKDHFSENNVYYKTVKAVPKPKVAFISTKASPLEDGLKSIYNLKISTNIPSDLDSYNALIFNDISYSKIKNRINDLTGYLIDGGGIVFIGGTRSFDKGDYKETLLESLMPVKIGTGKVITPLKHNIVIVLDVSESFSDFSYKQGGDKTALDLGKGMAVRMIDDFRDDISVGIVAFASLAKVVAEVEPLTDNRAELISSLERLGKGEGTKIDQGLIIAELALDSVKGTKNVILITDGKMGHNKEPHGPMLIAKRMAQKGIKIYTVGLPSELYDVDINRGFLAKLAAFSGGSYFEPSESQFLNVFFGKPEAKDKVFSGSSNLAITDRNHFITQDMKINARVSGVNFVLPKMGAKNLIFTGDGNPILNTWNFGLGRVTTLATDDGGRWAGELLKAENSLLLTRIINYAVGNPEKDREIYINVKDGHIGDSIEVKVKSQVYPSSDILTFKKEGEDIYTAEYNSEEPGYFQFLDSLVAVNPENEYYTLGVSNHLKEMVELSGGKILSLEDKNMFDDLKSYSKRLETQRKDLKFYPIAVALLIFMIEIVIRKIIEFRGSKV